MKCIFTLIVGSIAAATLILLATGCGSSRLPGYHPAAPSATSRQNQASGIEIAADPFVEADRSREYFGVNASGDGIGIVYVHLSNTSSSQTFIVQKKNFELIPAGADSGQAASDKRIDHGTAGGEATAMVGAALSGLGGLGLMLGGSAMIAKATEVRRNFVGAEMPDQTLAPGEKMEGFIYFQPVLRDGLWSRGARMKINLLGTQTHETVSVILPLSQ